LVTWLRSGYKANVSADGKINISLAYSYLDSEFKNIQTDLASKYLISSLKHQVTNTVDYQYKNFTVLFATRFNERATGASYWVNDFRLSQTFNKFVVFADAQNIFNATYFEAGSIPLPSRWFTAGVKFVTF
jgi:outer membrane receptor for ferrienterochelin and colicin